MRLHFHIWEGEEDEPKECFNLKYTGIYDDHLQFSGPAKEDKPHYEVRVFFEDLPEMRTEMDEEIKRLIKEEQT